MKGLREKFRNRKGFTLVEMLIVVAIIAILVAVSIPLVNNALDRAKHATDAANERSAKAEILIQYLSDDSFTAGSFLYDAVNGSLVSGDKTVSVGYGKHHADQVIAVKIDDTSGEVTIGWVATSVKANAISWDTTGGNVDTDLCINTEVSHK